MEGWGGSVIAACLAEDDVVVFVIVVQVVFVLKKLQFSYSHSLLLQFLLIFNWNGSRAAKFSLLD